MTAKPSPKAIARVAVTRTPSKLEAQIVGWQAERTRPFTPDEFAKAENDQRKTERRHRPHDRIAGGEPRRDQAPVEQRQRRRNGNRGDPSQPLRAAGIRNLPRQHRAQCAERTLRQIENSGSPIENNKPNTGEDINRAGAEARYNKRSKVGHHSDLWYSVSQVKLFFHFHDAGQVGIDAFGSMISA